MPNTRKSDPYTSREAADSVVKVTDTQYAIYTLLKTPMTDQDLVSAYRTLVATKKAPMASESGIRSRRAELVQLSLIKAYAESKSMFGRKCLVWRRA